MLNPKILSSTADRALATSLCNAIEDWAKGQDLPPKDFFKILFQAVPALCLSMSKPGREPIIAGISIRTMMENFTIMMTILPSPKAGPGANS